MPAHVTILCKLLWYSWNDPEPGNVEVLVFQNGFDETIHLISRQEDWDPPESAVALTDAHAAQHSLLVHPVLTQELANDVPTQTEAHNDQLGLRICPLNVANHCCKLPSAPWKRATIELLINKCGHASAANHIIFCSALLAQGALSSRYHTYILWTNVFINFYFCTCRNPFLFSYTALELHVLASNNVPIMV